MLALSKAEREEREMLVDDISELWNELSEYCFPHIQNSLRYYFGISVKEGEDPSRKLFHSDAPNGILRSYRNMLWEKRNCERYRLRRLETDREAVKTEAIPSIISQPKQEIGWEL
jgi:hypothetical protein